MLRGMISRRQDARKWGGGGQLAFPRNTWALTMQVSEERPGHDISFVSAKEVPSASSGQALRLVGWWLRRGIFHLG
jgi:hypothetical protein